MSEPTNTAAATAMLDSLYEDAEHFAVMASTNVLPDADDTLRLRLALRRRAALARQFDDAMSAALANVGDHGFAAAVDATHATYSTWWANRLAEASRALSAATDALARWVGIDPKSLLSELGQHDSTAWAEFTSRACHLAAGGLPVPNAPAEPGRVADPASALEGMAKARAATPSAATPPTPTAEPTPQLSTADKIAVAVALYIRDPSQSVRAVAAKAGVSHTTLLRSDAFKRAQVAEVRTPPPSGFRTDNGDVEATDDD